MKILIADNNDSFTWNLVDLLRGFPGSEITVKLHSDIDIHEAEDYQKIIFSPGPGLPHDFQIMNKILEFYGHRKDILGICLGHQAICEYFGGKLFNLPAVVHGQTKRVLVNEQLPLFSNLPDEFEAGLYHSWTVDPVSLPEDLKIQAVTDEGLLMAVRHIKYRIFGLQFHPESHLTPLGQQIVFNFLEL